MITKNKPVQAWTRSWITQQFAENADWQIGTVIVIGLIAVAIKHLVS